MGFLRSKRGWLAWLTVVIVLSIDRVSKFLVVGFGVPYRLNSGGAFSLAAGSGWFSGLSVLVFVVLASLLVFSSWRGRQTASLVGLGLMVGGGLSNLADRWRGEGVIDFIRIWIFPEFNLADVAIVAGLCMVVLIPYLLPSPVE